MSSMRDNRFIRFLRNYGPIPTNDNMYDETIQRALRRLKIDPLVLPTRFLEDLLNNFRSQNAKSEILTGTAGDGKTYHCREVWVALGGSETEWNRGGKVQRLPVEGRELVVVKDLSELRAEESARLLTEMADDVAQPNAKRIYLIAANHGQLLEKLKAAPEAPSLRRMVLTIEELLVNGVNPDPEIRLNLRDLSQAPASQMISTIIEKMTGHPGWDECAECPAREGGGICAIWENRLRIRGDADTGMLKRRLTALVELSEQNGIHFPVRQLLALITNILLGHPEAPDGLMSCGDVVRILSEGSLDRASVYRNVFGENLKRRRAEKTDLFKKLNAFGIGGETSSLSDLTG
jgi:hypothetical protein